MDRKDAQMQKILPALALSFAVQTAVAGSVPADTSAGAPLAGGLMHATLVVPAQPLGAPHDAERPALRADLQAAAEADLRDDHQGRDHTTAMLLAALALMAGIVLRRWGTERQ
jgi:hypothetical protein